MKRYTFILSVLTIAAGLAQAQMGMPPTFVQQYTFAPLGIIAGQTLRLNLANAAGGTSVCMGNLSFVNSDGTIIKNEDVTVKAGATMSYTLVTSDVTGNPASAEVRGYVKTSRQVGGPPMGNPAIPPTAQCSAVMSLELTDANGTHIVLTNPTVVAGGAVPILSSVPPSGVN